MKILFIGLFLISHYSIAKEPSEGSPLCFKKEDQNKKVTDFISQVLTVTKSHDPKYPRTPIKPLIPLECFEKVIQKPSKFIHYKSCDSKGNIINSNSDSSVQYIKDAYDSAHLVAECLGLDLRVLFPAFAKESGWQVHAKNPNPGQHGTSLAQIEVRLDGSPIIDLKLKNLFKRTTIEKTMEALRLSKKDSLFCDSLFKDLEVIGASIPEVTPSSKLPFCTQIGPFLRGQLPSTTNVAQASSTYRQLIYTMALSGLVYLNTFNYMNHFEIWTPFQQKLGQIKNVDLRERARRMILREAGHGFGSLRNKILEFNKISDKTLNESAHNLSILQLCTNCPGDISSQIFNYFTGELKLTKEQMHKCVPEFSK